MSLRRRFSLAGVVPVLLALPSPAVAAPPGNDARTAPLELELPASVDGTTVESGLEPDEPASAGLRGSVFYELTAPGSDRVSVRLDAAGDLDARLDVFERRRSQLAFVDTAATDEEGRAELSFVPREGATYSCASASATTPSRAPSASTCSCQSRRRADPAPSCRWPT